ncbi:hypothetical protein TYRP_014217 [Tyrophagus putrescentiae]|nr:hypothetical protein TYRP_014217 [Tyrophagus putrescentiae]
MVSFITKQDTQHQTPQPLTATERSGGERDATELDNDHLNDRRADEDAAEDDIGGNAREDVLLTVDLPTVDFIEERHEDEGVEDDGVVLRGGRRFRPVDAAVNVEEALTDKEQQHEDDKLVEGIAADDGEHRPRDDGLVAAVRLAQQQRLRGRLSAERQRAQRVHDQIDLIRNRDVIAAVRHWFQNFRTPTATSICTAFSGLSEMAQALAKAMATATTFTVS